MAISAPTFRGFDPAAIEFMADLAANNDRAWFEPRKADPKRSIFRIYRDTRFSKDKSPHHDEVRTSAGVCA